MSILELARKLNAVETLSVKRELKTRCSSQPFSYLLVLDFEATCWTQKDTRKGLPEIIEFPCVLYDVKNNKIVSEFQQYVMPLENEKLSLFCTQLTGITQNLVDNGVPLGTCLMLFKRWLSEIVSKYKLSFESKTSFNKCIFTTWSDWDLEICLKNECTRKRLTLPDIFYRWIDVRLLYIEHYSRRPKGLYGALVELGLDFEGNQHCGLHDARNTAKLVGRMIVDGLLLRITKDISKKN